MITPRKIPEYKYQPPSYKVPKQKFIQRYPRLAVSLMVTTGLLIFYSRPIYDIFIRDQSERQVIDLRNYKFK